MPNRAILRWLLRCITKDYPSLNNRVLKDLAAQEEQERIKRAQREERIRKMREEREVNGVLEDDTKPTQTHVVRTDFMYVFRIFTSNLTCLPE